MKKIIGFVCVIGVCVMVGYSMFGERLQANEATPEIEETSTTESDVFEDIVSQAEKPADDGITENDYSIEETSGTTEEGDSTEPSKEIEVTTETTSESTTESSKEPEESSTTESSTSTNSSISESSESSSTSESEETIETTESNTTTSSQVVEEQLPEVPVTEEVPPAIAPAPTPQTPWPAPPATSNNLPNYSRPSDATLSSSVELDESLLVSEVAATDLNGFELPLLKSFETPEKAVLIYEGLKQLDQEENNFTSPNELMNFLTVNLFNQEFSNMTQKEVEEGQAGDLIYNGKELLGLYLGEDHYLTVVEKSEEEVDDSEETEEVEEDSLVNHSSNPEVTISLVSELEESPQFQSLTDLTLTNYGEAVQKAYPASLDFTENDQTQSFIDTIGEDARELGLKYDVFASVMIAQAILESGSGSSGLSSPPHHNLFGIKGSFSGSSVSMSTQEDRGGGDYYTIQAAFRSYPNYGESLGDYVTLIREGIQGNSDYYKGAWRSEAKNYLNSGDYLTGKYATDSLYNRKLATIIAVYHLTQFDEPKSVVGTESGAILQGKENIPEGYRQLMTYPDYDGKNYNHSGSYPVGQCTWYAFNRVAQLGKSVDDFMGNGGEWGTRGRALGYKTSRRPKAGWLVSFSPGSAGSDPRYGHVAFVEAVGPDGILISEGNVVGGTIISYRVIDDSLARSNLVTYVQPK